MQLKGKTAIITGAAGGIGRATVFDSSKRVRGLSLPTFREKVPRKQPIS